MTLPTSKEQPAGKRRPRRIQLPPPKTPPIKIPQPGADVRAFVGGLALSTIRTYTTPQLTGLLKAIDRLPVKGPVVRLKKNYIRFELAKKSRSKKGN